MKALLIDEGLPTAVAVALRALDLAAHAVGDQGAPPRQSSDETNCQWCVQNDAVLVTNDLGKKDKVILKLLAQYRVHAIFVHNDLRFAPPHHLARALLCAEERIEEETSKKRGLLRHRLKPTGRLEKR